MNKRRWIISFSTILFCVVFILPVLKIWQPDFAQAATKLRATRINVTNYIYNKKGTLYLNDKIKVAKAALFKKDVKIQGDLYNSTEGEPLNITDDVVISGHASIPGVSVINIDFNKIDLSSIDTAEFSGGQVFYNENDNKLYLFDGVEWVDLTQQDTTGGYTAGDNIEITDGVISAIDTNTTYTAGDNIDITGGVISADDDNTTYTAGSGVSINEANQISADLGGAISSSEIENGTIMAEDLQANAIDGSALSSTAIEQGDIQVGDLPLSGNWTLNGIIDMDAIQIDGLPRNLPANLGYPRNNVSTALSDTADYGYGLEVVLGSDGLPLLAYSDNNNYDIYIAKCTDLDCITTTTPVEVVGDGSAGLYFSMTIGSDYYPVIAYQDITGNSLKVIHCEDELCKSFGEPQEINTTSSNYGSASSITIAPDGYPAIAYWDEANNDLEYVHCTSLDCDTHDTANVVSSTNSRGQALSLSFGIDQNPVIAYYYATGGDVYVAHCSDDTCGTVDADTAVVTTNNVGSAVMMTIGTDGYPIIVYYDSDNFDTDVVHCTSRDCSSAGAPVTVTTTSGAPGDISIGIDGLPVIAHYNSVNQYLSLTHCSAVDCSAIDPTVFVYDDGGAGYSPRMIIGSDGNPFIVHLDSSNAAIYATHTANPYGIPYWTRR